MAATSDEKTYDMASAVSRLLEALRDGAEP
jgi:hypothetical protein